MKKTSTVNLVRFFDEGLSHYNYLQLVSVMTGDQTYYQIARRLKRSVDTLRQPQMLPRLVKGGYLEVSRKRLQKRRVGTAFFKATEKAESLFI